METKIIIRQFNYWSEGTTLQEARENFKRVSGRYPKVDTMEVIVFRGEQKLLDRIQVDDMGTLYASKELTKIYL